MTNPSPLLAVKNLRVSFRTRRGLVTAVRDVSFSMNAGETLCLIGESGSGKSVTGYAITGLLPPGRLCAGEVRYDGQNLLDLPESHMRRLRGKAIAIGVQDAMSALDPVYTIGQQNTETLLVHDSIGRRAARGRAIEMLDRVGIPDARQRMDSYPGELSGGMKQRAVIAIALICGPRLLIADEPTTALDVTIQAQILELLRDLQRELGMALLFITHDLGVVAEIADRVVVAYGGSVVESAPVSAIYDTPRMPYTRGLLDLAPHVDRIRQPGARLAAIPGAVPDPRVTQQGCAFAPRCAEVRDLCRAVVPDLEQAAAGHAVRCLRWRELPPRSSPLAAVQT